MVMDQSKWLPWEKQKQKKQNPTLSNNRQETLTRDEGMMPQLGLTLSTAPGVNFKADYVN